MSTLTTFEAEVTQFKRPNGNKIKQYTRLPIEHYENYKLMRNDDYEFTAEVLATDEISLTVSDSEEDMDCEVVSNGPEVQKALIKMLGRKSWL